MHVGLGLPAADPAVLLDWACRADAGPFSVLGLLDRLVYDNPEPLVTLAGIAGATTRIRLQTEVLLAPLRDPVLLAKQCTTLDRLSGGRFRLGLGVGGREDDFLAAGADPRGRGRRLDEQLAVMRSVWSGSAYDDAAGVGPIGPAPLSPGGPELLFGAFAPRALARVGRYGGGFLCAAPPAYAGKLFRAVERGWTDAGRTGRPRLVGQVNVAVGPAETVAEARRAITGYYGSSPYAADLADRLITEPGHLRETLAHYAELGADELVLYCWSTDPGQVDRLARLTGGGGPE